MSAAPTIPENLPLGPPLVLSPASQMPPLEVSNYVDAYLSGGLGLQNARDFKIQVPADQAPIAYLHRKLSLSAPHVREAVVIDPQVMHGNPVLQGTRIPLYQIIEELADGSSLKDLVEGYPALTLDKIQAGLDFVVSLLRVYDEPVPGRPERQPEGD